MPGMIDAHWHSLLATVPMSKLLQSDLSYLEKAGIIIIADGVPEVTKRAREIMRVGASQIKAMAGGGVSFPF